MSNLLPGEVVAGMGFVSNFLEELYSLLITEQLLDYLPNILLAIVLGAFLGFERRHRHKTAGVRTHMLISASSALITLCGLIVANSSQTGDPTRLAGQIFAGIDFVGAGVILKRGIATSGVTTAATIFYACGVGIACGFSMFALAIATTLLMVGGMTVIGKYMQPNDHCHPIVVTCRQAEVQAVRQKFGPGTVVSGFVKQDEQLIDLTIQPQLTTAKFLILLDTLVADPSIMKITTTEGEE